MKYIRTLLFSGLALLAACSSRDGGQPKDTPEQIDSARVEGREAARIFVNSVWEDTLDLQRELLEARVRGSRFDRKNHPQAAAAFDSAFVSTVKTVRPDVARELMKVDARLEEAQPDTTTR